MNNTLDDGECSVFPDIKQIQRWKYWFCGLLTLITGLMGMAGNILSLIILCKQSMRNVFTMLLSCLCFADVLFIGSNIVLAPLSLGYSSYLTDLQEQSADALAHIGLALSIFLTIAVTIERYQSVCDPFEYEARVMARGKFRLVLYYFVPAVILSIIFNIPRFITQSSLGRKLETNLTFVRFYLAYQAFHPLTTTGLIPLVLLSTLNWKLNLRIPNRVSSSRRRAKEFSLARVCTILVLVFLVLNLPRLAIGLYEVSSFRVIYSCYLQELRFYSPTWQWCADTVARYLAVLNSSINFLIYCSTGSQFRTELLKTLHLTRCSRESNVEVQPATTRTTSMALSTFNGILLTDRDQNERAAKLLISNAVLSNPTSLKTPNLSVHQLDAADCTPQPPVSNPGTAKTCQQFHQFVAKLPQEESFRLQLPACATEPVKRRSVGNILLVDGANNHSVGRSGSIASAGLLHVGGFMNASKSFSHGLNIDAIRKTTTPARMAANNSPNSLSPSTTSKSSEGHGATMSSSRSSILLNRVTAKNKVAIAGEEPMGQPSSHQPPIPMSDIWPGQNVMNSDPTPSTSIVTSVQVNTMIPPCPKVRGTTPPPAVIV